MTKHMRIVDAETGAELSELGMVAQRKARVCRECRFCERLVLENDRCLAKNCLCSDYYQGNRNADCELWEPLPPATSRPLRRMMIVSTLVSLGGIIGFLLRGCIG